MSFDAFSFPASACYKALFLLTFLPCTYPSLPPYTTLNRVLNPPLIPQLDQLLHRLIKRHNLTSLLRRLIISVSPIDRTLLLLLGADDHDEVVQRQLRSADLLLHRVARHVDVGVEFLRAQDGLHFTHVVVGRRHDGDDHDLARGEPEGPAAGEVFGYDAAKREFV